MTKKFLSLLFALILTLSLCSCSFMKDIGPVVESETNDPEEIPDSYDGEETVSPFEGRAESEGLEFSLNEEGNGYILKGIGTCADTVIVIPSAYKGLPVTAIGDTAFRNKWMITAVLIPESVTEIGKSAFRGCIRLTEITLPDSVTTLGADVFCECTALEWVVLSNSLTEIPVKAFFKTALEKIVIPKSVTKIGDGAFSGCEKLAAVFLSEGVTEIGSDAFSCCYNLTEIALPDSVKKVGAYAFSHCIGLETVKLSNSLKEIPEECFWCSHLAEVVIPASVKKIGRSAFSQGIAEQGIIVFSEGLEEIEWGAFQQCLFSEITLPASLNRIAPAVFSGCYELEKIVVDGANPFYRVVNGALIDAKRKTLIAVNKFSVIPDDGSVKTIEKEAFSNTGLISLTVPSAVKEVSEGAFDACGALEELSFAEGVETVGKICCRSLKRLEIPLSMVENLPKGYDDKLFSECWELQDVYFAGTEEQWIRKDGQPVFVFGENCTVHFQYGAS